MLLPVPVTATSKCGTKASALMNNTYRGLTGVERGQTQRIMGRASAEGHKSREISLVLCTALEVLGVNFSPCLLTPSLAGLATWEV